MNTKLNHVKNWPELAREANWRADKLANLCGVSVRTLERHFRQELGKSPKTWLSGQRQKQVIELLLDGSTVKETANCLDYKHPSHLTNEFKKHWGCCPTNKVTLVREKCNSVAFLH